MGIKQFEIAKNFGVTTTAQQNSQSVMKINLFPGVPACDIKYAWLAMYLGLKYHTHCLSHYYTIKIVNHNIHPNSLLAA